MKKAIVLFLSAAVLFACSTPNTSVETAEPTTPTATESIESTAAPEPESPDTAADLEIPIEVTDGQQYGCDVVCWFDGFGFCYCVEDASAAYAIRLSDQTTAAAVYSEDERISFPRDSRGYCVWLASETTSYRIGFLRLLDEPHLWGYGTLFELLTEEDPQAELLPEAPQFDYEWSNDAAWFEAEEDGDGVFLIPTEFEESDVGFDEVEGAEGEPYPIEITDETLTMICFFDSQRPDMLVTKDRMLQLVWDGYFLEYPCWVVMSNGKLLAAMQINSF